jgi:hypothetical protein
VRQVIIVAYSDGSAIKGVYGPYAGPENAKEAKRKLASLPGMGETDYEWTVFPLHELFNGSEPEEDTGGAAQ